MKKMKIANLIMAAVILTVALAGVFTVGHIQGWFNKDTGETAVLTGIRGLLTMERGGIAYNAEEDTVLRSGDKLTCSPGASCVFQIGEDYIVLGEKADITINDPSIQSFSANMKSGEIFVSTVNTVSIDINGKPTEFTDTAAWISLRSGVESISVLYGKVNGSEAGRVLEWADGTESTKALEIHTLNDFAISQIRSANEHRSLCFSNTDLDNLTAARESEMQAQLSQTETSAQPEASAPQAEPETTDKPESTAVSSEPESPAKNTKPTPTAAPSPTPAPTPTAAPTAAPTKAPAATSSAIPTKLPTATPTAVPTKAPTATPAPTPTAEPKPTPTPAAKNTCTISIRCDTILSNMDNLDPAKAGYVPGSGVILSSKTVEFTEGETVFDILQRVCSTYGIQLEYSWTPMYNSYYIEGINNIYEFDCGSESGWMYKVNGWFPNYGCSSYTLQNGDSITWCYTCVGLGADVGA